MRLFLDTNIIIDYIGNNGEESDRAKLLDLPRLFGDSELVVSAKSYTDVFFVLKRYISSAKLQQAILDTLEGFQVCSIDADDIKSACQHSWDDFEDALIAVCAEKVDADYLITRDSSFKHARIPAMTPQEFLDMMREKGVTYTVVDIEEETL
jgi:predicted nucleic acid-binding protein